MKRKLLVTAILFLCITKDSYSQWKPVKTLQGGEGRAIFKANNILYLMVQDFGIMRSLDTGVTWTRLLKRKFSQYGTFSYMSADGGLVTVDTLLSSNTGNSWQTLQIPLVNKEYSYFDVFDSKVYYVGKDSIAISSDTGATWNKYKLPHNSVSWYANRIVKSEDKIYLVNEHYALYSTNDSGITWDSICPIPNSVYSATNVIVKGDTILYRTAWNSYRSYDNGASWTFLPYFLNVRGILYDKDTLYIATWDSVFLSMDFGNTLQFIGTKQLLASDVFAKIGHELIIPSNFYGAVRLNLNSSQITQSAKGIYGLPAGFVTASHDS
ncbi:MAG: hypothetical protein ABI855_16995, partial [Bacteroidota bacterium]